MAVAASRVAIRLVIGTSFLNAMGGGVALGELVGESAGRGKRVSSSGADFGPDNSFFRRTRRGEGAAEDWAGGWDTPVASGEVE